MDRDKLRTVVEAIPPGRWMSYADVCVAAGGFADEARSVNQRLMQLEVAGAHRVLSADGRVAATALGDPERARPPRGGGRGVRRARPREPGRAPAAGGGAPQSDGVRLQALGQDGLELGLEALLGVGPDDLLGLGAVLEEDQGRDREDLEVRGRLPGSRRR